MIIECLYEEWFWYCLIKLIFFIYGVDLIMCYKLFFYRYCLYKNEMGLWLRREEIFNNVKKYKSI